MPQLTPAGLLETVPEPVPALLTVRAYLLSVKFAVTDFALVMVTVHVVLVPVQAPLQPLNVVSKPGVAVRVTVVL